MLLGEIDNYQHGNIQQPIRIKQEPPDMYMGQQYGNQPGPSNSKVSQYTWVSNLNDLKTDLVTCFVRPLKSFK